MTFSRHWRLITLIYLSKLEPKTEEEAGESDFGTTFLLRETPCSYGSFRSWKVEKLESCELSPTAGGTDASQRPW